MNRILYMPHGSFTPGPQSGAVLGRSLWVAGLALAAIVVLGAWLPGADAPRLYLWADLLILAAINLCFFRLLLKGLDAKDRSQTPSGKRFDTWRAAMRSRTAGSSDTSIR